MAVADCKLDLCVLAAVTAIGIDLRSDECLDTQGTAFDEYDCNDEGMPIDVNKFAGHTGKDCKCRKLELVVMPRESIVTYIHTMVMVLVRTLMNV